ncbi:hypothetical protein EQW78_06085 [Oerskovia turbata]|uniref:Lipoprotein n=1 Tax=Oerskovia turbata TaxID=1713 RepID=A0A4Q1KY16_9CELL|nr:hypothetical protein [Oerskovia turbata]RXR25026.1 hypothetical protein EQW73_12115 [Oerskovia turbata]RXR35172.1 hypothetical protein EQW78_06085 [Oerskovia turbata]
MKTSFLRPTTALAVVALLALGACSGEGGTESSAASPTSSATDGAAGTATESTAVDAATDAASAADADAAAAEGDPAVDTSFCAETEAAWAAANTAQVSMSVDHPRTLVTGFENARVALTSVEPPADVAADWKTVTSYVSTAAKALAKADSDAPKEIVKALDDAGKDLDTDAMTAASARVTAYLDTTCGG